MCVCVCLCVCVCGEGVTKPRPRLGQPGGQVERPVHHVGVLLERQHAHEVGEVPREFLAEVVPAGPVLDFMHAPHLPRVYESGGEGRDANGVWGWGFRVGGGGITD